MLTFIFSTVGTRTIGVISKVDQAASDQRSLAAVQALLSGQGPSATLEVPWVAMIGQSVAIAAAHSGAVSADDTLETAWKAEMESLKSILNGASPSKLGRIALVDTLGRQIRKRMKQRLPNILSGYVAACPRCDIGYWIGEASCISILKHPTECSSSALLHVAGYEESRRIS